MFQNREQAGELLVHKLEQYKGSGAVVLGIPRGGVVTALVIASLLNLPLDIIVVKKIGAPDNAELAIGAVGPEGIVYWDEKLCKRLGISHSEKLKVKNEKLQEQREQDKKLRGGKSLINLKNKTVILVDDGVATGATVMVAAIFLKKKNVVKSILAVPVIAKDTLEKIKKYFDEIVFIDSPEEFYAVGQFYKEFPQVEDEEVRRILASSD